MDEDAKRAARDVEQEEVKLALMHMLKVKRVHDEHCTGCGTGRRLLFVLDQLVALRHEYAAAEAEDA